MVNITVAAILTFALLVTIILADFALINCQSTKKVYFNLLIVPVFMFVLGYLLEVTATSTDGGFTATKITYLGSAFISPLYLLFAANYCEVRIVKPLVACLLPFQPLSLCLSGRRNITH